MLLAREEMDVNAVDTTLSFTALDYAGSHAAMLTVLLRAGADPTIRNHLGKTPLDYARGTENRPCIALLEAAALINPQVPFGLLKARALVEAAPAIERAAGGAEAQSVGYKGVQRAALAAAPAYLKERVAFVE